MRRGHKRGDRRERGDERKERRERRERRVGGTERGKEEILTEMWVLLNT